MRYEWGSREYTLARSPLGARAYKGVQESLWVSHAPLSSLFEIAFERGQGDAKQVHNLGSGWP
jgi:hypothetical protein